MTLILEEWPSRSARSRQNSAYRPAQPLGMVRFRTVPFEMGRSIRVNDTIPVFFHFTSDVKLFIVG